MGCLDDLIDQLRIGGWELSVNFTCEVFRIQQKTGKRIANLVGHEGRNSAERGDLFAMCKLFIRSDQPPLFATDDTEQDADDNHVDSHRDKNMLNSLLDVVAVLCVFGARIITLDPRKVTRP